MSEFDKLQTITGLLLAASMTTAVAGDKLAEWLAEQPEAERDAVLTGDIFPAFVRCSEQLNSTVFMVGAWMQGKETERG